ncbi:MAG: extracellular solute-binding protein [Lachnospiraceae bacterium]|nr:extracellular solute-binding protein [Lachnospiraceae bacterium]
MKKFLALLLTLTMAGSLAACGSKPAQEPAADTQTPAESSSGEEKEAEASGEDVVITFCARQDPTGADAESAYTLEKIEEFNAMDNGIKVDIVWNPVEADYLSRLATDIASNDCPNIFMEYGGSRILDYLEAGLIVDMTPYYEEDSAWYDSVYPAMWEPCVFDDYEGIFGIPFNSYEIVLVYNSAYLEQCELEVPTTWEELMNCCKVLKENGIQPFMVGEKDTYRFGHLFSNLAITSYGQDAMKMGTREIGYDSEESKEIYKLIKDAFDAGYFGDNVLAYGHSEERAYTGAGECAFMWDLTSRIYWLEDTQELNAENLHIAQFPAVNKDYYGWCQGGASQAYYVSSQATEEEIAASITFLKYITSEEFISGLSAVTNSTYAIAAESSAGSYIYEEVAEVMGQNKGLLAELQNYDSEAGGLNIVRDALQSIVLGATPDDVANTIIEGYEDIE